MSHHIWRREVTHDERMLFRFYNFDHLNRRKRFVKVNLFLKIFPFYLLRNAHTAHFWLQIVRRNFRRWYQNSFFFREGFFATAVEEKCDVGVFFSFYKIKPVSPESGIIQKISYPHNEPDLSLCSPTIQPVRFYDSEEETKLETGILFYIQSWRKCAKIKKIWQ